MTGSAKESARKVGPGTAINAPRLENSSRARRLGASAIGTSGRGSMQHDFRLGSRRLRNIPGVTCWRALPIPQNGCGFRRSWLRRNPISRPDCGTSSAMRSKALALWPMSGLSWRYGSDRPVPFSVTRLRPLAGNEFRSLWHQCHAECLIGYQPIAVRADKRIEGSPIRAPILCYGSAGEREGLDGRRGDGAAV